MNTRHGVGNVHHFKELIVGVNIQIIEGRLGQDPERKTVGDTTVTTISVAVDESWKDKKGDKQKKTEWFEVNFWGESGDNIVKFFHKGDGIFVQGKTETRTYEDKQGVKQYRRSVRGVMWSFPPGKAGEGGDKGRSDDDGPPAGGSSTDDIPF